MATSKLLRSVAAIFKPPFIGLGAVVWLYFAWCFLVHPHSPILHGAFPDPDDYMYLTHTLDWLKGQSWFDTIQHRLNPPDGVLIHFSRITELPLALLILPLHFIGFSWVSASIITAAIWPLVLLAAMLTTLKWLGESFIPRDWTRVTAYVALFATPLMYKYSPGQVDHHGLTALTTALAFGCTTLMMQKTEKHIWGVGAGFFLALGQVVGLETLPWLLLLSGWIGLWMMVKGNVASRIGLVFGLTLYITSALFLFITKPLSAWFDPNCLSFSIIYVILAGQIAVCCAGVALASQARFVWFRYAVGILLSGLAAIFFLARFPELLAGPYGAMDKSLAKLMFDNIIEAAPLVKSELSFVSLVLRILFPLLALGASARFALRAKKGEKGWLWLLTFLLILTAIVLSIFYQVRFILYAALFSIVPLTEMLRRSLKWAATRWRSRKLFAAEVGLILLVGPLPAVLLPALTDGRTFNQGILLFPVVSHTSSCNSFALEPLLNLAQYFGDKQHVVMNTLDEGPELLFRTNHFILSAPYHMNIKGTLDSTRFFTTSNPEEAKQIARERRADLVVMCGKLSTIYASKVDASPSIDESGKPILEPTATFAEQLVDGKVPNWLKRFEFPILGDYMIFEVKLDGMKQTKEKTKAD